MKRQCSADILIDAPPQAVWSVVSDVTRVGEWSGECRGCTWESPSDKAEVGARFRGKNRRGAFAGLASTSSSSFASLRNLSGGRCRAGSTRTQLNGDSP